MIQKSDKVLITGCGGMLGEAVYKQFKDRSIVYATDKDTNEPWLEYLDVSSPKQVDKYLAKVKPDYIIHLAAFTDMEYCELHPEETYATNEGGVKNFVSYVYEHNIPFVYISTAGIFDGEKDAYQEDDIPNPLSVYGKSKFGGELAARTLGTSIVIRAGWMMGSGPRKDKKFINKIIKQLRTGTKELAVVDDKLGVPCYTYDLAHIIGVLLDKKAYGIYHGACSGGVSRYDVARYMVDKLPLNREVTIRKVDSDFFKESYFAPRPKSEKLLNTKIPELIRDWQVCLDEYLTKFNWNLTDLNMSGMERSFYHNYFWNERNHWLMKVRRLIALDQFPKSAPGDEKKRVLDFCCGSGYFTSLLDPKAYETYGLDVSAEAIAYGTREGIPRLAVLDSHSLPFPDNYFDVITSFETIVHFEQEEWALKEMERVLKPGGVIIMTNPAFMFLWGLQDQVAHYYRRYTASELARLFAAHTGLRIDRTTYFNSILFLPIVLFRKLTSLFGIRGRHSDFDVNNGVLNFIFYYLFILERWFLKFIDLPFGVAVLLVAHKEAKAPAGGKHGSQPVFFGTRKKGQKTKWKQHSTGTISG